MTAAAAPRTPLAAEITIDAVGTVEVEVEMVAHMVAVVSIVMVDASNVATMLMKLPM